MNILPKRRNLTSLPPPEEPVAPEPEKEEFELPDIDVSDGEGDEPTGKEDDLPPPHKEDTVFNVEIKKKPKVQENNYIEPKPPTPKKKKKKLSEKQLAHLARMRVKSAKVRAQRIAGKKEATRLKKLERAKKKAEREKKAEQRAQKRVVQAQKTKKVVQEAEVTRNKYRAEGYQMGFKEFFGYMDRYDKMKSIRKRNAKVKKPVAKSKPITVPAKSSNPYADWF
jgi:membrane protein involved in colicin uptake|tara:strand:- start:1373 stop:2044 length:672 start_codon:yes stop_codon:yes gene_type:complete